MINPLKDVYAQKSKYQKKNMKSIEKLGLEI